MSLIDKLDGHYHLQEKDVIDLVSEYIERNHFQEYLKDIVFDVNSKHLGCYNVKTNRIILNDDRIIKSGYNFYDNLCKQYNINEDSYIHFLNYFYLRTIYHELTHVSQKAKYEQNFDNDSIYNYLYELCEILRYDSVEFYNSNHDLFPMEIEANNTGCIEACKIMEKANLSNHENLLMYLDHLCKLLVNYERKINIVSSPIEKLYQKTNIISANKINRLTSNEELSTIERINLGLRISPVEYDCISEIANESHKVLCRK